MAKNTSEQFTKIILRLLAQAMEDNEIQLSRANLVEFLFGMLSASTCIHNQLVQAEDQKNNQEMTYLLNSLVLQQAILSIDKDYFKNKLN